MKAKIKNLKKRADKHQAEQGLGGLGASGVGEWRPQGRSFCFCSANVCLLPDSLARFNNLADTQRRAREVGKRIRNGASRPQIKIYIDSPTNTSISAASFSSLATGFRRTSSLDQRPDHAANGPADCAETEPLQAAECPIHPDGAPDCPLHNTAATPPPDPPCSSNNNNHTAAEEEEDCPLHSQEGDHNCPVHTAADCPAHPSGEQQGSPDHHASQCPMHQDSPNHRDLPCAMHHQTESQSCPKHDACPMHHQTESQSSPKHDSCPMHHQTESQSCPKHDSCPMHHQTESQSCPKHDPCPMHHQTESQSSPNNHHDPCPMHQSEVQKKSPNGSHSNGDPCPLHQTELQKSSTGSHSNGEPCTVHEEEALLSNASPQHHHHHHHQHDCALVQISISEPEDPPPPREDEEDEGETTGNHRDAALMCASSDSLNRGAEVFGGSGGGMYPNNTLSHVPRMSVYRRGTSGAGGLGLLRKGGRRGHGDGDGFDHDVSAFFPANLDFLALQEVFDHASTARLRRQLHRYFPYVLSDVGRYGWKGCCSRFKFLNSGLLLASRYPILDARYECFPNGRAEDALAAKGALFAKVQVGTAHQDQRVVGFITTTHLHAIEGDAAVRCEQLDLILQWGADFRQSTCRSAEGEKVLEDLVAFDVLLGDLNFDNCSSEDKLEQQHALFTQYKDPCRLGPGEDKPWALGTLLDPSGLYDDEVNSPESLQKVMENEEGRKEYLVFPPSKGQSCHGGGGGGGGFQKGRKIPLKGNGRRIDYILYSDEGLHPDWKLDIEEYSFVTQLAGLTDHLSVSARLSVSTGEEES